jgi:hypothetical protein
MYNIETYLITRATLKELTYAGNYYTMPSGHKFRSLRVAKTYIKRSVGMLQVSHTVQLAGSVKSVTIEGTLEF